VSGSLSALLSHTLHLRKRVLQPLHIRVVGGRVLDQLLDRTRSAKSSRGERGGPSIAADTCTAAEWV
jgi:hypothetical protein